MRAALSMFGKELDQVRGPFLWFALLSMLAVAFYDTLLDQSGGKLSHLTVASLYATTFLIVIAFAVGHVLIVREYYRGTQHFISALPINRLAMATVKYVVGLVVLLVLSFATWTWSLSNAQAHEPIGARFALIMATRLLVFVLALWSIVYTFSFLGRLRVPILAAIVVGVSVLDSATPFELGRFGPMLLVNDQVFTSERFTFPVTALLESVAVAIVPLVLCRALLLRPDGNLVERLAVPMTRGEISFLAVLVFGGLVALGGMNREPTKTLPTLGGDHVMESTRLVIGYPDDSLERDVAWLFDYLAPRLDTVARIFDLPPSFRIRVTLTPLTDPYEYHMQYSDKDNGVSLSTNFRISDRWSRDMFGAFVVHQMLAVRYSDRVLLEPNHAMLDGFSMWIVAGDRAGTDDRILPLGLYADDITPMTPDAIRRWDPTAELLGDALELALTYTGWVSLESAVGRDAAIAYAKAEFDRPVHLDIRDFIAERFDPMPARFRRATGMSWPAFLERWRGDLDAWRRQADVSARRARIPARNFAADATLSPAEGAVIDVRLDLANPLPYPDACELTHGQLPFVDVPVNEIEPHKVRVRAEGTTVQYRLAGEYATGTRVFIALDCYLPVFGYPLRMGTARLTVP